MRTCAGDRVELQQRLAHRGQNLVAGRLIRVGRVERPGRGDPDPEHTTWSSPGNSSTKVASRTARARRREHRGRDEYDAGPGAHSHWGALNLLGTLNLW